MREKLCACAALFVCLVLIGPPAFADGLTARTAQKLAGVVQRSTGTAEPAASPGDAAAPPAVAYPAQAQESAVAPEGVKEAASQENAKAEGAEKQATSEKAATSGGQKAPAGSPEAAELVKKGTLAAAYGSNRGAIALFKKALKIEPANPYANFYLGIALGETGQYELGLGFVEKAIAEMPDNAMFLYGRARIHLLSGKGELAEKEFEAAAEGGSEDARIYLERIKSPGL
jgi:tetratricopeptide (TPR) repeat protein